LSESGEITQFGNDTDGDEQANATHGLNGAHHWIVAPLFHLTA
jgi:hypothetical protein